MLKTNVHSIEVKTGRDYRPTPASPSEDEAPDEKDEGKGSLLVMI